MKREDLLGKTLNLDLVKMNQQNCSQKLKCQKETFTEEIKQTKNKMTEF